MVFCQILRIYKAKWRLEKAMKRYSTVRKNAKYKPFCWEKYADCYSRTFKQFFSPAKKASGEEMLKRFLHYGYIENTILRSLLLYMALVVVLAFVFVFNVLKFPSDPFLVGLASGGIGAGVALLMAVHQAPGCIVCVMLPTVVTNTSRAIVILLALSWTIQGPMMNMQENLTHTTKTIACMQSVVGTQALDLQTVGTKMKQMKFKPFVHLNNVFQDISNKTTEILKSVESGVTTLGSGLRRVNNWLSNVMLTCNDEVMKPYEFCVKMFKDAANRCDESIWFVPFLSFFCRAVENMKFICKIGLILQKLCGFKGQIAEKIRANLVSKLSKRISQAEQELLDEYGFNFTSDHSFDYSMQYKSNVSELYTALSKQFEGVRSTMDNINTFFGYLTLIMCIQLPVVAALYLRRFMNSENVDNYFITHPFRKFDRSLMRKGKESAIPLMHKERKSYIPRATLRATTSEIIRRILSPLINVIVSSMVIGYWIFLDVSVYTFLHVINSNLRETIIIGAKDKTTMLVSGDGVVADAYKNILHDMTPEIEDPKDIASFWTDCIYEPNPPDKSLRIILVGMLIYALVSIFIQLYAMRTQSLICELFFPDRIRARLRQLHSNILAGRGSWKMFASKCIQKQLAGGKQDADHQLKQRIAVQMQGVGGLIRAAAGRIKHCFDCNDTAPYEDFENFRHCENFDCQAPYCIECYFRVPKCLSCKQIKQADDLDIDEEEPGFFLTKEEKKEKTQKAKKRVTERKLIEMYSAAKKEGT